MIKNMLLAAICLGCLVAGKTAVQEEAVNNHPPVVVLGFDDAEESQFTIVAPLLKKYGFDATFFVCEFPRKESGDSIYYMTWPQIAGLHRMGFEIGNHTGHHKGLVGIGADRIMEEVSFIEEKCRIYGIPRPVSFAYPGNREDSTARAVLKQMGYKYARAGSSRYFDPLNDPLLAIPSYTMGSTEKLAPRTRKALEDLQPGQILAFTIHGVPDILHPDYTTDPQVFEDFLRLMKDRNFKVIALRDLGKYIGR
jgi:peptidoglycan/xylan/chitin deacetylase (PgdA/CDA1 family)